MNTSSFLRRLWREWVRPLALPFLVITAAKSAIADINPVPSGSMEPTVVTGDVVFVNKLAYDLKVPFTTMHVAKWADPARGDVVVCFEPEKGTRLLKRVIAVPGDVLELRQDVVWINGHPLTYSALDAREQHGVAALDPSQRAAAAFAQEQLGAHSHAVMVLPSIPALRNVGPLTVPAGEYFVMGDNRDNSRDSRYFGFVPRDKIVGEARGVFVSADLHHWLRPRFERFCTALD